MHDPRISSRVPRTGAPRTFATLLAVIAAAVVAGCQGGMGNVGTDVSTGQAMLDLGQNMIQLREDDALLQAQIDSLRGVVAYQDSILRQLAALSGLSMRSQSAPMP